jgi:hypothetical protein
LPRLARLAADEPREGDEMGETASPRCRPRRSKAGASADTSVGGTAVCEGDRAFGVLGMLEAEPDRETSPTSAGDS